MANTWMPSSNNVRKVTSENYPTDVGQKHTEPKEPPADPKPSAEPTPQVEPPANPGPVLDMDGKTEDGSIPYNILMKQLECMK